MAKERATVRGDYQDPFARTIAVSRERLEPHLSASKSLRLPQQPSRSSRLQCGPSSLSSSSGSGGAHSRHSANYSYNSQLYKRALPEPQCRCAAAVAALKPKLTPCGKCVTCGQPSMSSLRSKTLVEKTRSLSAAQQLASNGYIPSYRKVVQFNLKPSYRITNSAPPLQRSRSLESAVQQHQWYDNDPLGTGLCSDLSALSLRKNRHLPHAPAYKHPTSPTMPMAKLKLYKDLLGAAQASDPLSSLKRKSRVSPVPKFNLEHALANAYRGSLPGSPVRARPAGASFFEHYHPHHKLRGTSSNPDLMMSSSVSTPTSISHRPFPSLSEVTKPPVLEPSYMMADRYDYNYDNYFRSRRHDLLPFYKSAPPSRPSTPPCLTKYVDRDSPRNTFKKQLKYFVEERKSALGIPTDYTPQTGSESDLNALLTLYSSPPDPILEPGRCPPPGAPTYQSVPQAYTQPPTTNYYQLRKHSSSPSILGVSPTAPFPPGINSIHTPYSPTGLTGPSYGPSSLPPMAYSPTVQQHSFDHMGHFRTDPYLQATAMPMPMTTNYYPQQSWAHSVSPLPPMSSMMMPTLPPLPPVPPIPPAVPPPYQGISGLMRHTPSPLLGTSSMLDYEYEDPAVGAARAAARATQGTKWASTNY